MTKSSRWLPALLLAVLLSPGNLRAQGDATVTGRVTSEAGQPLASVSVFIESLNVGTLTRSDGTYTLNLPAGELGGGRAFQVTAQILGYRSESETIELRPGGTARLNFQLETDVLQLEGVVATGIGQTTTRERLGVSISSVSGEELTRVASTNIVSALAAKAPNVEITSAAGDPGASSYIRIRGVNTIDGSGQPLFVVDGVPVNNQTLGNSLAGTSTPNRASDINPNDIASIEILKGAAAAAIYGARAANGVILISTKSGQPGQTRVSFTSTVTTDEVNKGVPLQTRYGQGLNGQRFTSGGAGLRSWGPEITGETFDHWGELFETGQLMDNNLSMSGGSERTRYYLSVGRMDHDGVIVGGNDYYERTTARLKASHEVLDNLSVSGNFAYAQTDGSFIQKGSNLSGLLLGGLRTPPDFNNQPYLTEEGFHRAYSQQNPTSLFDWDGFFDNPFWTINENRTNGETGRMFGNIAVDYQPREWLSLSYTLGNDYTNDERLAYLPIGNFSYNPGYLDRRQYSYQEVDQNLLGTITRSVSDAIGGSLTLGYNRNSREFTQYNVEGYDFVAPGVFQLDNTVQRFPNEFKSLIHAESYFGQLSLDIADQLFLTGALRNDGFSTFGESERRHWYPKVSAAWEVSRALGLSDAGNALLSFAKLRAAWGQAGNEPPVYGTLSGFAASNIFDGGWGPSLNPTYMSRGGLYTSATRAQPDLGPERTSEFEVGMDVSLLNDRAGLDVTYYNAQSEGVIFDTPLAPSTGFDEQLQNAADISNRGIEVSLNLRPVTMRRFSWDASVNWATNDNEVLSLGDPDREFVFMSGAFAGAPGAAVVGYPAGVLRGFDFARCGQDTRDFVVSGCAGAADGTIYIADTGFPILDPTNRVIMNPHPDWTAGIRNSFTILTDFQISTLFDIKQGGEVWNGTRGALYSYGTHKDTEIRGLESTYADFKGVPAAGPGAETVVTFGQNWFNGLGSGFGPVASQFIEDGSYVKLREIAVSYNVPVDFAGRFGMSSIDLRLAARNLKTWTDYTGIDPETNLAGTTNLRGVDYFNNPQTRQFILTVGLHK